MCGLRASEVMVRVSHARRLGTSEIAGSLQIPTGACAEEATVETIRGNDQPLRRRLGGVLCAATLGGALTFIGVGTVSAAVPLPLVTTTAPASAGSSTSAIFTGTVNPNGLATTYYFIYGTSTKAGFIFPAGKTAVTQAGSGSTTRRVTATVRGLAAHTVHEVELAASNSAGVSYGHILKFTTARPAAVTNGATAVTARSARLNASVNPNGTDAIYYFQIGKTTSYGITTALTKAGSGVSSIAGSLTIGGLRHATKYNYRVVARNAFGTRYGPNETFRTK